MKRCLLKLGVFLLLSPIVSMSLGCEIASKKKIAVHVIDNKSNSAACNVRVESLYMSKNIIPTSHEVAFTDERGVALLKIPYSMHAALLVGSEGVDQTLFMFSGSHGDNTKASIVEGGPLKPATGGAQPYSITLRPGWSEAKE